jgi:hypothetical protein
MKAESARPKRRRANQTAPATSARLGAATSATTNAVQGTTAARGASRITAGPRGSDRTQTTGQGAASTRGNVSVNITPEQRTRIHEIVIKERSAPRVEHVDFSLSVGTVVPRSIRIVTIPRAIIEIEPEWDGFDYFMVGEEIIIVNPRSMEIVAILAV